ncbi:nicotianamine synthase 3-like [Papaver somniferum]|uniref:nicotianamine synthase 3-like n=1 Tax=Papaver somniferum TaxID=3469 RepID=UPI000E6F745D|nr:nicotianamine synthase 3-like [Papaver somniferum]
MFHNYDIDRSANALASNLVSADPDLSERMLFHDTDIMDVTTGLSDYEVVFLAALVGLNKEDKRKVIDHLAKHMAPGSLLMLRGAHGARGFLYPIVEPSDLPGFEVLAVFHPMDDVINWSLLHVKAMISTSTSSWSYFILFSSDGRRHKLSDCCT